MKIYDYDNGVYRELTPEEIAENNAQAEQAEREYLASIDYDEAVHRMIREKYSDSQEFAILRQRDEKPEEYREYYDYCEYCKAFVKQRKEESNVVHQSA